MQVRKFEARTMKEALQMVKFELGPDAIILAAKDNSRRYGMVGQSSVEVTAAVPDGQLKKKEFVEARIPDDARASFRAAPARQQKSYIEKTVAGYQNRPGPKPKYIDMQDDSSTSEARSALVALRGGDTSLLRVAEAVGASQVAMPPGGTGPTEQAKTRIRNAAQKAADAFTNLNPLAQRNNEAPTGEIKALKDEVESLRKLLTQFQNIPQQIVTTHPGADLGLNYEMSASYAKLIATGMAPEFVAPILLEAQKTLPALKLRNPALIEAWAARQILESTSIWDAKKDRRVQIFMGPNGVGKTSSLVKLASHSVIKDRKKIAIGTTDLGKVGAADQLKVYAQILGAPFAILKSAEDWENLIRQAYKFDHIYIDFPGLSLRTMGEIDFIRPLLPPENSEVQRHLVLSATQKDNDVSEVAKRYKFTKFDDLIFCGLDESAAHGSLYNASRRFEVPLHSFGVGAKVPEDFERATKERILDLILKISSRRLVGA